jgi:hypothetical protein
MKGMRLAGVVLLTLGVFGLAYERFTYTEERHSAEIGPLSIELNERKTVDIPLWVAVGVIVIGAGLAMKPTRRA